MFSKKFEVGSRKFYNRGKAALLSLSTAYRLLSTFIQPFFANAFL